MSTSYLHLLGAVAPVLIVIASGFAVRRLQWLSAEADRSLLSLVVNLLTPCLIFDNVIGNSALRNIGTVLLAPVLGFATVVAGFAIGLLVARILSKENGKVHRTFAVCTGLFNYGYIPLPLAIAMFDTGTVGVLFLFNLGVELALWTVGVMLLSGSKSGGWRKAFNPPVASIIAAVLLNFAGGQAVIPPFTRETIHLLAGAAIPLGLLLTGATVADLFRPESLWGGMKLTIGGVVLRAAFTPWLFLALAIVLPASTELKRVLVIQAAMPAAVVPMILTRHYGGDPATALRTVFATTCVGILSIPFWLKFGFHFTGLQ